MLFINRIVEWDLNSCVEGSTIQSLSDYKHKLIKVIAQVEGTIWVWPKVVLTVNVLLLQLIKKKRLSWITIQMYYAWLE